MANTVQVEEIRRGPLVQSTGAAAPRVRAASVRWLGDQARDLMVFKSSVSPVDTGRFRDSNRFGHVQTPTSAGVEIYSTDIFGKQLSIEFGHTSIQPNRVGRFPVKLTVDHFESTKGPRLDALRRAYVEALG